MSQPRSRPQSTEQAAVTVWRDDVWRVDLDPTRGSEIRKSRPAVVLSADGLNQVRRTLVVVVVVPMRPGPTPRPPIVVTTASSGADNVAVCDQVRAVDKSRLITRYGLLTSADLRAVENGVRAVLEL